MEVGVGRAEVRGGLYQDFSLFRSFGISTCKERVRLLPVGSRGKTHQTATIDVWRLGKPRDDYQRSSLPGGISTGIPLPIRGFDLGSNDPK